jgi:hypothetical protein
MINEDIIEFPETPITEDTFERQDWLKVEEIEEDEDEEYIDPATLPQAVVDYVEQNYADEKITKAEKDEEGFEVYLTNGLELYFDAEGNFVEAEAEDAEGDTEDTEEVEESTVTEAEVNSDEEFMEYAMTVLKKAHGDNFDEAKAKETAEGILSKVNGDYGAAVGILQSSLNEEADTSTEIEKQILDMGQPTELKKDDDLITKDQVIAVEPKAEADDTSDATEVPEVKGDGSETAAGIAGDIMAMGEPKEEPASKGEELVTDEQPITATVERRIMDFSTFVNESYESTK